MRIEGTRETGDTHNDRLGLTCSDETEMKTEAHGSVNKYCATVKSSACEVWSLVQG